MVLQVRDLQLAMAELHDQFRDEETVELRELQRELEVTAKACRIAQFKLRKVDRRCDQLDAERAQAEERVRCLENCLQGSVCRQALIHKLSRAVFVWGVGGLTSGLKWLTP